MTPAGFAVGVAVGAVAGVLSGVFGVGGGVVMTPGIQILLGAKPIVALATPLPVIVPTALTGALTYRRAGEIDVRAAAWMVGPGMVGSIVGALLTDVIDAHLLLLATAGILAWQATTVLRARTTSPSGRAAPTTPLVLATIGLVAGCVSGLLGIGGGIVIVPLLAGWLGMPLKRALGTSLLTIVALAIPGTIVHTALGHVDGWVFLAVAVGAIPGARVGAALALGAAVGTLRLVVALFLLLVAAAYGVSEAIELLGP
jgi:uncharacterized protein